MTDKRKAVALGDFDGMHRAHQTVVTGAEDVTIYCVNNRFSLLQKSILEKRYPNAVFADFGALRDMDAAQFVEDVLIKQFGAGIILCGYNFRFGKNAMWSAMDLRRFLAEKDIWVRILEHLDFKGEPISSSRIRTCLQNGNIADANEMLGYCFTFESEVIAGDKRGRTIGFPTINQHLPEGLTVPRYGVYESRTFVGDKMYRSFTNLGIRPSWRLEEPLAETHLFDFDGDLYGQTVRVELVQYLREEKHFSSTQALKEQLTNDKSSLI